MRKISLLFFVLVIFCGLKGYSQQVTVTASCGAALRNYTTVKEAFDAINIGIHCGVIVVSINANTNEGTTPATLNSSDADPAAYTSVTIRPTSNGITVQGNPAQGFGVIQFNGADNVILEGDNPNTAGTNRNLTIVNSGANTTQFSSVVRIATSPNVLSANNIIIRNCIINGNVTNGNVSGFTATVNNTFGIYAGGNGGATSLGAPLALTDPTGNSAPDGTTINNLTIQNNEINRCARAISFIGAESSVNNILNINSNIIGTAAVLATYPYVAPATTVYARGINVAGTNSALITGNTIQNVMQYGNNSVFGIELFSAIGSGTVDISGNTVSGVVNNAGSSDARGIMINSIGAAYTVNSNTVSFVESSSAGLTSGIYIGAATAPGTIGKNTIHSIFSRNIGGAAGINLATASNDMAIQNNFIYDIKNNLGSSFTTLTRGVSAIYINSGSNHKIYHNSVHLYHASTATASNFISCFTIGNNTLTGIDVRNNIFVNTVTGGTASDAHVSMFMPFATSAAMNLTLNNNAYYTGSIAGKSGVAFGGVNSGYDVNKIYTAANFNATVVTPATNWRSFSSLLGVPANDNGSFALTTPHPYTSNTNLHIPNGATTSPLESGAVNVGVTTDIDNQVRPGPAGSVNGGGLVPDIGADEFDRQLEDKFPPVITFTPPVACGQGPRILIATIDDVTGVPTAGIGLPRLYYRIAAGAWNTAVSTWLGSNQYSFTIDPGGTATLGQLVEYYIVAQDIATIPNIIASPSTGAGGYTTNPPVAGTPPTVFFSYTVTAALATGTYNVGGAGAFTTLTAAVNAYNNSCLNGPVVFNLIDATYPSETFPITINANSFASAINTLTIKPNTTATVGGNHGTALIKFNGADYIIIDGSNNGTSSQNLTINNTNINATATVLWVTSASTTNGATNNTIKNTIITGSGSSTSIAGIVSGSGTTFGSPAEGANSNNTVNNCLFRSFQNGLYINGKTVFGDADQNWVISNNTIGSTVASEKMGFRGLSVQNISAFTISGNTIAGVNLPGSSSSTASGISIFGNVSNGNIFNNKINDVRQLGAFGANGIFLGSGTGSNINVYNNFIWEITGTGASGTASTNNGYGIMINSGGGYNIYFNSVWMGTNQASASGTTAAINISSAINTANALNIRNNIFANTQSNGIRYSIFSGAAANVFADINYNDYYHTSATLGFLGASRANLGAWQAATGRDGNSISVNPVFVSATDLHVQNISPLNALATPIAVVTNDIDLVARNVTTPDIGADEFIAPPCNTGSGGVASVSFSNLCGSGSATLSSTGYSLGEGLTYQWQYSTTSSTGPWVNLPGQTNPAAASTGVISATTYYQLVATCSNNGANTPVSNPVTVTINNPTVTGTTPGTRCGPGTVTLQATSSPGSTLNWYAGPTGGPVLTSGSPFVTPSIPATTTFYVSAQTTPPVYIPSEVSDYIFSTSTGAGLDPMSGATITVPSNVDDQPGIVNNIGFVFNFGNTDFTQFSASADGWILLGGATAISQFTNSVTSTTNIPKIFPYWDDHATGSDGNVRYVLTGSAPNRILKVHWQVRMPRLPLTDPSNTAFQAWLYEGSNKIEFRYGVMASTATSASVGLTGTATSFQSVTVSSNTSSNAVAENNISTQPANGRMYTFTPRVCESPRTAVVATITTPPAINAAVATPATICEGQSTTLSISSPNDPNYSYTWTPGSLPGASVSVSPATTTTYTVTGVDISGGANAGCTNVSTVTVNVNELPGVVNVSPPTISICAGASVPLSATGGVIQGEINANSGAISLTIPDVNATGISHSLAVAGIPGGATIDSIIVQFTIPVTWDEDIIVNLEAPNGQLLNLVSGLPGSLNIPNGVNFTNTRITSDNSFPAILTGTAPYTNTFRAAAATSFQLNPLPTPSQSTWAALYGTPNGNWTIRCYDDEAILVGTLTNWRIKIVYTANATFTWSPAAGLNTTVGANVIATPASSTTYYATATNDAGCTRVDSTVITVNSSSASVSIAAVPGNVICAGTSVTFTATPTNGGPTPAYQWKVNGGNVGVNSPNYTTATLINGDIVTVVMTSSITPCTPAPATSNAINMTVNPNPTGSVTGSASVCANSAGNIYGSTVLPAAGTVIHSWSISGSGSIIGATNGATVSVTAGAAGSFTLTNNVTRNGCPGILTLVVNITPTAPASVIISGNNCVAPGNPITFTAVPTNGGTPTYQWYLNPGGIQVGETASTYTYAVPVNGTQVWVEMVSTVPCALPSPAISNILTVSTNTPPTAVISTPCATMYAGDTLMINASGSTAGSGTITGYQWYQNGSPVGVGVNYPVTGAGLYTVTVTNSNGCNTTSSSVNISVVTTPLPAGNYSIPGPAGCNSFARLVTAINYINTYGISGAGGVIFNVAPGYTETAPAGGFRITRNGTAANQIIFRNAGASPVITASSLHVAGSLNDAIFKIVGADYISIRGFTLQEHALAPNLTAGTNNMTEFGIALLQASLTDGTQNDSIAGNIISLNKNYPNTFGIYSNAGHAETTPTVASSISNATGSHSNVKIFSNIISNVNTGIALLGSAAGGFYDAGNDIGGSSLTTGNTITNWGGLALSTAFINAPAAATNGVVVNNQTGENISYNTLTSATPTGAGINFRGIHKLYSVSPAAGTFTSAITNNIITLTSGYTSAAYEFQPIKSEGISALLSTATININTNSILNNSVAAGGTPSIVMINNTSIPGTLNMNANIIKAFNSLATGTFTGISNSTGVTNLSINTNQIGDVGADAINTSGGAITVITSSGTNTTKTINSNVLRNITGTAAVTCFNVLSGTSSCSIQSNTINTVSTTGAFTLFGVSLSGAGVATISLNTINGLSGGAQVNGFSVGGATNPLVDNNSITNLTTTSSTAFITAMQLSTGSTITNNTISNLTVNSAVPNNAAVHGILQGTTAAVTISGNSISALSSNSVLSNGTNTGMVNGLYIAAAGAGNSVTINRNRIFNLAQSGVSATTTVNGIYIPGGSANAVVTVSNNFVSDLRSPNSGSAEGVRGIAITNVTGLTSYNLYYNTIYLKATSGQPVFGSSGLFHPSSGTATSVALTLRNNIIVNESTPNGSGLTVAFRKNNAAVGNYVSTSNNNVFYAGVPSAANLLYYDGTNSIQDMTAYLAIAGMSPRESVSLGMLPQFENIATTPYDLHLKTDMNCALSGTGAPIAGITDDIDVDTRDVSFPDIGADEFNATGAGLGVWRGINTIWMDPVNWCNSVPTATTNVVIPAGASFYPIITTAAPVARNITIAALANITIDPGGTLTAKGNVANSGTLTNNGNMVLSGTIAQTFPGPGTIGAMNNLEVNNAAGANIDRAFAVSGALLPTLGTITLNNNHITIASNATTGTARVGQVGTSNAFVYNGTGRFIVERYIKTGTGGGQHGKSWQLLSTPTSGQTINAAWQEGNAPAGNAVPNYGAIITGTTPASGFDFVTPAGASMKTYNWSTPGWDNILNTTSPIVEKRGYMVLVRGDRSVTVFNQPATPTTLRTTGQLFAPGTNAPPSTTVQPGMFESVGNPYASGINFTTLSFTNVDNNKFYVWDPLLTGSYGLGAYQTITGPSWLPVPGGTTNYPSATPVTTIQSGQAFLAFNSAGVAGTLGFAETNKVAGNTNVFRLTGPVSSLRTSLYAVNGSEDAIADGNLVLFDQAYASSIDQDDAIKMPNTGENFGILSHAQKLAVESRRPVTSASDTIFYTISNLRMQRYKLTFDATNIEAPGLEAYLADQFTGTHTPVSLSGATSADIEITSDAASWAPGRFMIVFKRVIPLSYTDIQAEKQSEDVKVSWSVSHETAIDHYEVERSADGLNFSMIKVQAAMNTGTGAYFIVDEAPLAGTNHYRIRSVSTGNDIRFSNIAKVHFDHFVKPITIYPNPIGDDKAMTIDLSNHLPGRYEVVVTGNDGRLVHQGIIVHSAGNRTYAVKLEGLFAHGTYMLSVIAPDGTKTTFKIIY